MANVKLSAIAAAGSNPAAADKMVSVIGGTTDNLVSFTQAAATISPLLSLFTTTLKGGVPASGGGSTNFLRADGTWAAPPGGGGGLPLIGTGATVTVSTPLLDLSQTWNAAAVAFNAIKLNVTQTANAEGSAFLECQSGGSSVFRVGRAANNTTAVWINQAAASDNPNNASIFCDTTGYMFLQAPTTAGSIHFSVNAGWGTVAVWPTGTPPGIRMGLTSALGWTLTHGGDNLDTPMYRDAAGIVAHRNSTLPQTLRVYNTFTDINNYERGVFDWTTVANTLTIGTDSLGTGVARDLRLTARGVGTAGVSIKSSINELIGVPGWFLWNRTSGASIAGLGVSSLVTATGIVVCNPSSIDNSWYTSCSFMIDPSQMTLSNATPIRWGSGADFSSFTADIGLSRASAGVLAIGNGTQGNTSGSIAARTKAGAPVAADIPAGSWAVIRDTSGSTTKLYYNNAGTLMSVALV